MPHVTIMSTLTLVKKETNVEPRKGYGLTLFGMAPRALISDITRGDATCPDLESPLGRWGVTTTLKRFILQRHPKLQSFLDGATCRAIIQTKKGRLACGATASMPLKPACRSWISPILWNRLNSKIKVVLMAPKDAALDLPPIFSLEFTDTHFEKELLADKNLQNYNDLFYLIEKAEALFADEEDILEDNAEYRDDLLSIRATDLHKIAAKLEVLPYKDLFSRSLFKCTLEKGILASSTGAMAIISGPVFMDLYKMPQQDMVYNVNTTKAFMKGKENSLQRLFWVPLLREIIINDKNPDLLEILAFNLHTNWSIAKEGRSFFMASCIVDSYCAYLEFDHLLFLAWPSPTEEPIHVLFATLLVHRYRCHISLICTHFYAIIYRAILGEDMPRIAEAVKKDITLMGVWWYFDQATIIRVEGTLTSPIILTPNVLDRLVALEVARQCYFGVAKRCKETDQRPYPHLPFKIDDIYFQNWPSLEKVAREIETMNLNTRDPMRQWDPNGRVQLPPTSLDMGPISPTASIVILGKEGLVEMKVTTPFDLSASIRVSPVIAVKPSLWDSPAFSLPIPTSSFTLPLTPDTSSTITFPIPPFTTLIEYCISTSLTASEATATLRLRGLVPILKESIMAPASDSPDPSPILGQSNMASFTNSPTLSQTSAATPFGSSTQAMSKQQWIHMQLARAEEMDTTTPSHPEVTLEYDKAISTLKKVTGIRVKMGEQVTTFQTEENLLSPTRKRKRGTKSIGLDDRELMVGPVSIVRIQGSLDKIDEWKAKLATLGNVARMNLLPNVPLLSLDEVVTCENVLAKTKQVLEDGDAPLVTSNQHLEISSQNILSLFDNTGLPQVVKSDNTLCT
eukprot:Gb_08457 [translate_table: standard]